MTSPISKHITTRTAKRLGSWCAQGLMVQGYLGNTSAKASASVFIIDPSNPEAGT